MHGQTPRSPLNRRLLLMRLALHCIPFILQGKQIATLESDLEIFSDSLSRRDQLITFAQASAPNSLLPSDITYCWMS